MPKVLNVQDRLQYARAAVAVLRTLRLVDKTMRYGEFALAIGLMADGEDWQAWHRQQTADILNVAAAVEREAGQTAEYMPLQFERIVNAWGEPGAGFHRETKIVRT